MATAALVRVRDGASRVGRGILGDVPALRSHGRRLRLRYPAPGARHGWSRYHGVSSRAHHTHVQPRACRRHSADPLCRGSPLPSAHSVGPVSGPLAGLVGALSRASARSRPGLHSIGPSCPGRPPTDWESVWIAPCSQKTSSPTGRLVRPLGDDGPEIQAHRLVCLTEKKGRSSPSKRGSGPLFSTRIEERRPQGTSSSCPAQAQFSCVLAKGRTSRGRRWWHPPAGTRSRSTRSIPAPRSTIAGRRN